MKEPNDLSDDDLDEEALVTAVACANLDETPQPPTQQAKVVKTPPSAITKMVKKEP